ncbi:DUF4331 family protein [Nonomuraea sp. KM90]|uniref:DUF4331 family protein n=1 Tax=Nonomuraea sp. KM90 TaxID=3457428 RepID=UPI003FCE0D86
MSHHLDSPTARQDPRLDITDLFVFRKERGSVLVGDRSHSAAGEGSPRGLGATGTPTAEDRTGETAGTAGGGRVWAGEADDPFWIEPNVLHAVGGAVQDGTTIDLTGWDPAAAKNAFAGHTVHSIVLELDDLLPAAGQDRRVGVWAPASLATTFPYVPPRP